MEVGEIKMPLTQNSRAPKQMGDFGEGLVNYVLIKKGYEVAYVDHVGADLISEKDGNRYAISVKTRNFKKGSNESRMYSFSDDHIKKIEFFSNQFNLEPVIAFVLITEDDKTLEVFIIKVKDILEGRVLNKIKDGYSIRFSSKNKLDLINSQYVDYSCWKDEVIGNRF